MRAQLEQWVSENNQKLDTISATIPDIEEENLTLAIAGSCSVTLIVPSDMDSSIMAFGAADIDDGTFNRTLTTLNDKLERLRRRNSNCLSRALDVTLEVLTQFCYTARKEKWAQKLPDSWVCNMAVEACRKCKETLFKEKLELENYDNVLAWCTVSVREIMKTVILHMDARAVFYDCQHVGRGLGFPLDGSNFSIDLVFSDYGWLQTLTGDFRVEEVVGSVSVPATQDKKSFVYGPKVQYGPSVLMPSIVKEFLQSLKSKNIDENEDVMHENIFLSIIKFVWKKLTNIKTVCVSCQKQLPSESRLWYCESELCMYKFEEFGTEASLLHDLQNTEVAVFEIACAKAASLPDARQGLLRDVFEPFPTYLLKEQEIRDRSGFFSDQGELLKKPRTNRIADFSNKNLKLLQMILESLPTVSMMKSCRTDLELKSLLTSCIMESQKNNNWKGQFSQQELAKDLEQLPYKVLKFILFTNRNMLTPVRTHDEFKIPILFKQFAVIYDSEKEAAFRKKREEQGSIFAFHGSPACNWYSIVRNGLKACSNTSYMSTGAAFGAGIYLAKDLGTSIGYSSTELEIDSLSSISEPKEKRKGYKMVVLCEVFNGKSHEKDNGMLVVPAGLERDVVIRYLLLFHTHPSHTVVMIENRVLRIMVVPENTTQISSNIHYNLVQHYEQQRQQHMQQNTTEKMQRRDEILGCLEARRMELLKCKG